MDGNRATQFYPPRGPCWMHWDLELHKLPAPWTDGHGMWLQANSKQISGPYFGHPQNNHMKGFPEYLPGSWRYWRSGVCSLGSVAGFLDSCLQPQQFKTQVVLLFLYCSSHSSVLQPVGRFVKVQKKVTRCAVTWKWVIGLQATPCRGRAMPAGWTWRWKQRWYLLHDQTQVAHQWGY